jgi:ribosome-binding ATPase YchF (GTP1/OBG family)
MEEKETTVVEKEEKRTRKSKYDVLQQQLDDLDSKMQAVGLSDMKSDIESLKESVGEIFIEIGILKAKNALIAANAPDHGISVGEALGVNEMREPFIEGGPPVDIHGDPLVSRKRVAQKIEPRMIP